MRGLGAGETVWLNAGPKAAANGIEGGASGVTASGRDDLAFLGFTAKGGDEPVAFWVEIRP